MPYGLSGWGTSGWGTGGFTVINQIPTPNQINVSRTPTIIFTLKADNTPVDLTSISVTANAVTLMTSGVFSPNVTGAIDSTNPELVTVTINVLNPYSIFELVTVVVSATTIGNETLASGNTWNFTTNDQTLTFNIFVARAYNRVLTVG